VSVLAGRVALVTGASRGIGRAIAVKLAAEGARIAVHCARDRGAAGDTLRALDGGGHALFTAELRSAETCRHLLSEVESALGQVDILVNNAGIYRQQRTGGLGFGEWCAIWDETITLNLNAAAHLSFLAARAMAAHGGGRIINISSRGAFRGEPDAVAYGASKAGLNALGQSLAQAFGAQGVMVAGVAPGFVDTDMTRTLLDGPEGDEIHAQSPMGRAARPEEVAETVRWLAAEAPMFVSGTIVDVNGASYLRS
jgi:NAD(P)-dependent dehydrogenase (short-subunit alcohol dehydrogenase family)